MGVGINGMGRMGRLALRVAHGGVLRDVSDPRADNLLSISHVNEIGCDAEAIAHLSEFDSVHGRWRAALTIKDENTILINESPVSVSHERHPGNISWGDLGCDIVLECTGKFRTPESLQAYFDRGVKRVIVAAPVKDSRALNVVVGVNDHLYDPYEHRLLTAASCTTNCLAPVVKIVHEAIGIKHGQITRTDHNDPRSDKYERRYRCAP